MPIATVVAPAAGAELVPLDDVVVDDVELPQAESIATSASDPSDRRAAERIIRPPKVGRDKSALDTPGARVSPSLS